MIVLELDWVDLVLIGVAVCGLCAAFWREGRLSGFDRGIEKGVEIGRKHGERL